MSHRPKQVASVVKRAVQTVLSRGLADPRIRGLVSVTEVEVSRDLRHATVKISVLPAEHESSTIHGLQSATLKIQRAVNEQLALRRPPKLRFEIDRSLKREADVLAAINRAVADNESGADETETVEDLMKEFNGNGETGRAD